MKEKTYKNFIESLLSSWHKFVPDSQSKYMLPSNCWYTNSFKNVPRELIAKLKSVRDFYDISSKFPQSEVNQILSAFSKQAVKFEVAGNQRPTGEFFCLPSVYFLGFPKCGTTTLYNLLTYHPDVEKGKKEGQFWGNFVVAPNKLYNDLEALAYTYRFTGATQHNTRSNHPKVIVDGSTHTVYDAARLGDAAKDMCVIPTMIYNVMPNTKIIIALRNPTSRQWSHYWWYCSHRKYNFDTNDRKTGLPPVPDYIIRNAPELFHNHTVSAINEFKKCIQSGASEFKCTYEAFNDTDRFSLACGKTRIGVSLYYFHVVKWLSVFPKEQVMITTLEELGEDSYSVTKSAWEFIGLDPIQEADFKPQVYKINKWMISNQYKDTFKIWPETKELLDRFFRPYNERLAKLLDDKRFLWS